MGILDEARNESIIKGPPCTVGLALEQMTEQDKADFLDACADFSIAGTTICRVLARHGYTVRPEALRRHRKKECRCE